MSVPYSSKQILLQSIIAFASVNSLNYFVEMYLQFVFAMWSVILPFLVFQNVKFLIPCLVYGINPFTFPPSFCIGLFAAAAEDEDKEEDGEGEDPDSRHDGV
jgi:hypothetical protein